MGIRFRCPQGHKLNVKSFLAGKRGICPHCGAKLIIPVVSDPSVLHERAQEKAQERLLRAQASPHGAAGNGLATTAAATSQGGGNNGAAQKATTNEPLESLLGPSQAPLLTTNPAVDMLARKAAADPIAEAPQAIWYVRPPAGGQYGPAAGDVMRKWIDEGRVSSDSLVWREGWAEWREAGPLFPNLPTATPAAAVPAGNQPRFT